MYLYTIIINHDNDKDHHNTHHRSSSITLTHGFLLIDMGVPENSVPLNPMVLLIIIPMKNGYLFGNIPNIFRHTHLSDKNHHWSVSKCSNTSQIPVDISTILISQVVAPGASLGHRRRGGPAPRLLGRRGSGLRGLRGARRQRHGLHGLLRSCGDQHHNHHGGGNNWGLGGKGQRGKGECLFFFWRKTPFFLVGNYNSCF